jgi:hypothetical protein
VLKRQLRFRFGKKNCASAHPSLQNGTQKIPGGNRRTRANRPGHPGVQWNDSNDLFSGTAGIGLALVHLARRTGRKDLLELAKGAGERLLALAHESIYDDYWTSSTTHSTHYPNFSHGI